MSTSVVCWKCRRSMTPLEKREKDPKTKKHWMISYCSFDRCRAALEIDTAPPIKLWNGSFFEEAE